MLVLRAVSAMTCALTVSYCTVRATTSLGATCFYHWCGSGSLRIHHSWRPLRFGSGSAWRMRFGFRWKKLAKYEMFVKKIKGTHGWPVGGGVIPVWEAGWGGVLAQRCAQPHILAGAHPPAQRRRERLKKDKNIVNYSKKILVDSV